MPRRRRSFTPEYRVKAAHMVIDGHRRVVEVAHELDVDTSLLHTWVRDERWRMSAARSCNARRMDSDGEQPLSVQERAELLWLRVTVAQQAKEIAYLEQVSACFAAAASKVGEPARSHRYAVHRPRHDPEAGGDTRASVAAPCSEA